MDLGDYVSGGYYLSRYSGRLDCTGIELRRVTMASEHTQRVFFPDGWTLSWCRTERSERIESAAEFGIAEAELDSLMAWADETCGKTWEPWSVFLEIDSARTAARTMLARATDLELWGVGLHRSVVGEYCAASAPPPSPPGYAPNGASGTHVAVCRRGGMLAPRGEALGHELLLTTWNPWFNSPESAHLDEAGVYESVGVSPNADGLIDSFEDAMACCRHLGSAAGATPKGNRGWLPWLIVRYPIA